MATTAEFRQYMPDLETPRFQALARQDAHEYVDEFNATQNPPWLHALVTHWKKLLRAPLVGVTMNGKLQEDVYSLQDQQVATQSVVSAVEDLLPKLSDEQRTKISYHIDSPEWRTWSNPEFLISHKGIRLDEVSEEIRKSVLRVLEASLSPEGYQKAVSAMRINGFLGELVNGQKVMNEFSYNFVIFGDPSTTRPWGWQFYGHHLCLNAFFYKNQMILAPWFTGAEPNEIDKGPHRGLKILQKEEKLALQLMQSLSPELQDRTRVYKEMDDPNFPEGRWNKDDQRHYCGAYRDNRVVPNEGITYNDMDKSQQSLVAQIIEEYLLYLPSATRKMQLENILRFGDQTYFSWIGGFSDQDAFYYRIQNPAIIVEFDHHSGVILTNKHPAKFHTHTLLRFPNAGDYGHALKKLIPPPEDHFVWNP